MVGSVRNDDVSPRLTICICTSGRPAVLERCLASIAVGRVLPREVIVSNDGKQTDLITGVRDISKKYAWVRYVEGPRRGLCANRNHVIRQATTSHVSLIDDDGVVSVDFVERALAAIAAHPDKIITGDVIEEGIGRCPPTNPRFLGHFGRHVRPGERLANIHLNCNVFPRVMFDDASFDESIEYGYEDTDLCAQLLAKGYEILYVPELVNEHKPPNRIELRVTRRWQLERARFYVTIRRHGIWQRNVVRLAAFLLIAPIHFSIHEAKHHRWRMIFAGWGWACADVRHGLKGSHQPGLDGHAG